MTSEVRINSDTQVSRDGRGSFVRKITQAPVLSLVNFLHRTFPELTANQITLSGLAGSIIGSKLAVMSQKPDSAISKSAALTTLLVSDSMDAIDGSLARAIAAGNHGSGDSKTGILLDVGSDRITELIKAVSRMAIARERQNNFGEILALVSGITNSLPSLVKAYVESSKGLHVKEAGSGLLGLLGTRAGRAVINDFSTVYPQIGRVSFQPIADTLEITSNLATAKGRLDVLNSNSPSFLSDEEKAIADTRFKLLLGLTLISTLALFAVHLHRRKSDS